MLNEREDCNCGAWNKNIPRINGVLLFSQIHGVEYGGETFNFCPYCGEELKITELKESK